MHGGVCSLRTGGRLFLALPACKVKHATEPPWSKLMRANARTQTYCCLFDPQNPRCHPLPPPVSNTQKQKSLSATPTPVLPIAPDTNTASAPHANAAPTQPLALKQLSLVASSLYRSAVAILPSPSAPPGQPAYRLAFPLTQQGSHPARCSGSVYMALPISSFCLKVAEP